MDEEERAGASLQRSWQKHYLHGLVLFLRLFTVKRESKDGHCLIA